MKNIFAWLSKHFSLIVTLILIFGAGFFAAHVYVLDDFDTILSTSSHTSTIAAIEIDEEVIKDIDLNQFWEVWSVVNERFAYPERLTNEARVVGAIKGMVSSLDDPYTEFFDPVTGESFVESVRGSFEGIGAEIGFRDGFLTVIAPLEGSPAEQAGLRPKDQILKIADEIVTPDITLQEAVALIRGPKGTNITLLVARETFDIPQEITVSRDTITVPTVRWEMKGDNTAYIRISHFTQTVVDEFQQAANEILSSDTDRIVLDLRNNPGGFLESAVSIAGWFVDDGEVVVIEKFNSHREPETYKTSGSAALKDFPIVVLINSGSASASEILAGALRDISNVSLVGETSFGKGTVQELQPFEDGSQLKITVAEWLTPAGNSIEVNGLNPDFEVEISEEDIENELDSQLEKAIEVVESL